jgi:tRNA (cytidine/uridine-2'-O-)-methyltransferase
MLHIALFEPEIPPNTGNIIRLCANSGASLHLIEPLGFVLDNKHLLRAGLDYHELACVQKHLSWQHFLATIKPQRVFAISTKGKTCYVDAKFAAGDVLLFGPETRGLPKEILEQFTADKILRIPMQPESRSLNLSNAAAIVLYEAWRQLGFKM